MPQKGLPYMLERAGLDVQQGQINYFLSYIAGLLNSVPFVTIKIQ